MTVNLYIIDDPMTGIVSREVVDDNFESAIYSCFDTFPKGARIYDGKCVSSENDITPIFEDDVKWLSDQQGEFTIVVWPEDIGIIIAITISVISASLSFFLAPNIPTTESSTPSANNELSSRGNRPRVNQRIEDIFGRVRSYPTLLSSYRRYINNREVEIALMCIGRGEYLIENIRDGDTPIQNIIGIGVDIYGPNNTPLGITGPDQSIGDGPNENFFVSEIVNDVNGQILISPNTERVDGDNNIRFVRPNIIEASPSSDIEFDAFFTPGVTVSVINGRIGEDRTFLGSYRVRFRSDGVIEYSGDDPDEIYRVGDIIRVRSFVYTGENDNGGGFTTVDLSGDYRVIAAGGDDLVLSNPASVNSDWNLLNNFDNNRTDRRNAVIEILPGPNDLNLSGTYTVSSVESKTLQLSNPEALNSDWGSIQGQTPFVSPIISRNGPAIVGPFRSDLDRRTRLVCNFTARNGLYTLDRDGEQSAISVTLRLTAYQIDSGGRRTGVTSQATLTLVGSNTLKSEVSDTLIHVTPFTGPVEMEFQRTTETPEGFSNVVDSTRIESTYSQYQDDVTDYGNVTLVHSQTLATTGALRLKERTTNANVTRMIETRGADGAFTNVLNPSTRADDILRAVLRDEFIGNQSDVFVDYDGIYNAIIASENYFDTSDAVNFCQTFDDIDSSAEDHINAIASAAFCRMTRPAGIISAFFDGPDSSPVMILNHRNILIDTQTITDEFGVENDHDGVEVDWRDENGDVQTFSVPPRSNIVSPSTNQLAGVANLQQAALHAWRIYNSLIYRRRSYSQQITDEAALLNPFEKVLIANVESSQTLDGDILEVDGISLTLSRDIKFKDGVDYLMHISHSDRTTEIIPISQGTDDFTIILSQPPKKAIEVSPKMVVKPKFVIVEEIDAISDLAIIEEISSSDEDRNFTVSAINYDWRYYSYDQLSLWIPNFSQIIEDQSSWFRLLTSQGSITGINDNQRGSVIQSSGGSIRPDNMDIKSNYTITCWINGQGSILSGLDFNIRTALNSIIVEHGSDQIQTSVVIDSNEWNHIGVSHKDGKCVIYLNGVQINESQIGIFQTSQAVFFQGNALYDNLRYYPVELTPDQVLSIYRMEIVQ